MNSKLWQTLFLTYLALGVVLGDSHEPTAEQKQLWGKIAEMFKAIAKVLSLVNADQDGFTSAVTNDHKAACQTILGEETVKSLDEEAVNNPKTSFKYEKDFLLLALLAKSKCLELNGEKPLEISYKFKKNIFKMNDDQACLSNIESCTNGYVGYLMVQVLKSKIRRMESLDLKEYFCNDNIDLLDGFEKKGWFPWSNNFALNFCSLPVRRRLLEKLLVKTIETRYGQKSTSDIYHNVCTYVLLNPELNKDHSETELPWKVLAEKVLSGCKKQAASSKPESPFPLKEEFMVKLKAFIDPFWKQVEDKIKASNQH